MVWYANLLQGLKGYYALCVMSVVVVEARPITGVVDGVVEGQAHHWCGRWSGRGPGPSLVW